MTPLLPRVSEGTAAWARLTPALQEALGSTESQQHFLVNGDEVNVLIYSRATEARYQGSRVQELVRTLPLSERPADSLAAGGASETVAYFMAGPLMVRHRGDNLSVRAALVGALGLPVGEGGRPIYLGSNAAGPPDFNSDPASLGRIGAPLYQGKHVPSWSLDPTFRSYPYLFPGYGARYYSNTEDY